MKKLSTTNSKIDADFKAQFLIANGIRAEVVGSREYSAIYTGTDYGLYELYVDEENYLPALRLLEEREQVVVEKIPVGARTHFRRALVFAVLSWIFLPVVLNIFSLQELLSFRANETDALKKFRGTLVLIAMQIPVVIVVWYLVKALEF